MECKIACVPGITPDILCVHLCGGWSVVKLDLYINKLDYELYLIQNHVSVVTCPADIFVSQKNFLA